MVDEILKEIRDRVEKENRSPMELYMKVLAVGTEMFRTHKMGKEDVVVMCSSMISIYDKLQNEVITNG